MKGKLRKIPKRHGFRGEGGKFTSNGGVAKSFTPWEGIRSEVSKMGPDASEVHIPGSGGKPKKRKIRLTKLEQTHG